MIPTHRVSIQLPAGCTHEEQFSRQIYRECFSPDETARGPVRDGKMYFVVSGEPDEPLMKKLRKYGTVDCEEIT